MFGTLQEIGGNGACDIEGGFIAGVDEAGRGPLAGPVSAAAVVFASDFVDPRIRDSKSIPERKREVLFDEIIKKALAYAVVFVGHEEIDRVNIREATRQAMAGAAERVAKYFLKLNVAARLRFLVDGNVPMATTLEQETIVKGDQKILAISAASILAKVVRDREMRILDRQYPGYGFSKHKGYSTKSHRERIKELGPSPVHRRTFAGVREHCIDAKKPLLQREIVLPTAPSCKHIG